MQNKLTDDDGVSYIVLGSKTLGLYNRVKYGRPTHYYYTGITEFFKHNKKGNFIKIRIVQSKLLQEMFDVKD